MFSFGEKFTELWNQIPEIYNYRTYCQMANVIDDARTNQEITATDEAALLKTLDAFKEVRGIKEEEG